MPRHKRIDLPGVIYHVISRGIEQCAIFHDDPDRAEFLRRLEIGLTKTNCQCFAWSLMPNHFHLLIRTSEKSLSDLMRGLLCGYAIYFNKRNKRHGYLYQNRYKSILCEEDAYFHELIRYIHLNPLRAGLITNIDLLDKYEWSGHSVIVGNKKREWQSVDEVLSSFGPNRSGAIRKYRNFVKDGIVSGKRSDLTGGGLIRSAGGWAAVSTLRQTKQYWRADERILGSGDFVSEVLKAAEEEMTKKQKLLKKGWNIDRLVSEISIKFGITQAELRSRNRKGTLPLARGVLAYIGTQELSISGSEIARYLEISRPAVSYLIKRGEEYLNENKGYLTF